MERKEKDTSRKRNARKDGGHPPSASKLTIYGSVATSVFTRRDAPPPTTPKVRNENTTMYGEKPRNSDDTFPAYIPFVSIG